MFDYSAKKATECFIYDSGQAVTALNNNGLKHVGS